MVVNKQLNTLLPPPQGDKYGSATADRANRFIVSNDVPDTAGFDQLHDNVAANAGQANAVVIAGTSRPKPALSTPVNVVVVVVVASE